MPANGDKISLHGTSKFNVISYYAIAMYTGNFFVCSCMCRRTFLLTCHDLDEAFC